MPEIFQDGSYDNVFVLVSLAQLVRTMHNICKVRGSNPDHHRKKMIMSFKSIKLKKLRIYYLLLPLVVYQSKPCDRVELKQGFKKATTELRFV
ncbi:hypothetical protein MTR_7g074470 [Medicago truncatula]|uniref:Uncharacterized protein n=1 Tax=Medicago truncatula TaxID=3880 RepID=G7KZ85_MEDTR|nr:hypothetical protein MTR_7g074470 [Medicago truncatula]